MSAHKRCPMLPYCAQLFYRNKSRDIFCSASIHENLGAIVLFFIFFWGRGWGMGWGFFGGVEDGVGAFA